MSNNIDRFPKDFMVRLTAEEAFAIRSQFVTASKRNIRSIGTVEQINDHNSRRVSS